MIRVVAAAVSIPLIVGGGLTDEGRVAAAIEAGADIVITGTAIEDAADVGETVARLAGAVHARPPRNPA
jgi:phosphoglycerol geranylgeranyltransferase